MDAMHALACNLYMQVTDFICFFLLRGERGWVGGGCLTNALHHATKHHETTHPKQPAKGVGGGDSNAPHETLSKISRKPKQNKTITGLAGQYVLPWDMSSSVSLHRALPFEGRWGGRATRIYGERSPEPDHPTTA